MATSFSPYGVAIYAETTYGVPPNSNLSTPLFVTPPLSASGLYDSLQINWNPPGGHWNQQILVRSSYGVPVSPFASDGVTLLYQSDVQATPSFAGFSTQYNDLGLVSGRFYYYALFVFSTDIDEWVLAGSAQGLCLTDYSFEEIFPAWLPDFYLEQDALLISGGATEGPFQRFLNLLGFEMNWLRSEIETLFTLTSPEFISGALLPLMAANLGIDYEPQLGMTRSRVLIENAVNLYKTKGTLRGTTAVPGGIQGAASAYSGYSCVVTLSPNIEIQLDDAAFDQSVGHWVPMNAGTSIEILPASTLGVTPQHASYLPIPSMEAIAVSASGYLPPNNENVAVISASSSYLWTESASNAQIPSARQGAVMAFNPSSGQTVLFGGLASVGGALLNDTWVFNGTYWSQLTPANSPTPRELASMAYDPASGKLILFGGLTVVSGGGSSLGTVIDDTWEWSGTNWVQLSPVASPPARAGAGMSTWSTTGLLLFGGTKPNGAIGVDDTWFWNGTNWASQSSTLFPSGRINPGMAYDSGHTKIILFGGTSGSGSFQDTWSWNGSQWTQLTPATKPSQRSSPAMVYDSGSSTIVLFGGFGTGIAGFPLGDMYSWNGTTWSSVTPGTLPSARAQAAFALTSVSGELVLFSGASLSGAIDDTWLWNGSGWYQIEGSQTPLPRQNAAIAYDTASSAVILFGGWNPTTNQYYNSTWSWNGTTWSQLQPVTIPDGVAGAAMAYSSSSGNINMYGGYDGTSYQSTTYRWTGTNWTLLTPGGGTIGPRAYHCMVYDVAANETILFGGSDGSSFQNDTWVFASGNWTKQTPSNVPPARADASMCYTTGGLSYMFGGESTGSHLVRKDFWQWNSTTNNWVQQTPSPSPPGRYGAGMVYDAAVGAILLFGGSSGTTSAADFTDTWQFLGGAWTEVDFTTTPYPRADMSVVYYPTTQSIFFFGGWATGPAFSDLWLSTFTGLGIRLAEATHSDATVLGIPIPNAYLEQATPQSTPQLPEIVLSAYFQPVPTATPVTQQFIMQLDWYGITGAFILSVQGTPATESVGSWVRAFVAAVPPLGAFYFGRSIKTVSQNLTGDQHMLDAVQTELNTQTVPGPTSWTPPRDFRLNLLPYRQNLILNGQGLAGSFGWTTGGTGTFTEVTTGISWPAEVTGGFRLVASAGGSMSFKQSVKAPVVPGNPYTLSFWLMPAAAAGSAWEGIVDWFAADGSFISQSTVIFVNETVGQFVQASGTAPAPSNAALSQFNLFTSSQVANSVHYFAAPLFEPASALRPYFDGNFATPTDDYQFEGTPNESISDYYPNLLPRLARLMTVMPEFTPIGSTFSLITGAQALANAGLVG